jgi:hypothetical protein
MLWHPTDPEEEHHQGDPSQAQDDIARDDSTLDDRQVGSFPACYFLHIDIFT